MYISGYTDVNSSHEVDKVAAINQVWYGLIFLKKDY